jgi:hypothetical protein
MGSSGKVTLLINGTVRRLDAYRFLFISIGRNRIHT